MQYLLAIRLLQKQYDQAKSDANFSEIRRKEYQEKVDKFTLERNHALFAMEQLKGEITDLKRSINV